MSVEGSADSETFGLYLRDVLCLALRPWRLVVMGKLSVHESPSVRDLVERQGHEL